MHQVRFEMAQALCVPETEHTYEDLMLAVVAQNLKMVSLYLLTHFEHSVNKAECFSPEQYSEVSTVSVEEMELWETREFGF